VKKAKSHNNGEEGRRRRRKYDDEEKGEDGLYKWLPASGPYRRGIRKRNCV